MCLPSSSGSEGGAEMKRLVRCPTCFIGDSGAKGSKADALEVGGYDLLMLEYR